MTNLYITRAELEAVRSTRRNEYSKLVADLLSALANAETYAHQLRMYHPALPVPDDTLENAEAEADSLWHDVYSYTHDGNGIIYPADYEEQDNPTDRDTVTESITLNIKE